MKRTPLRRSTTPIRKRRAGKPRRGRRVDPAYLVWIRTLACVCCLRNQRVLDQAVPGFFNLNQASKTEAAHVGPRGLGQKCSDRQTVPLCALDHHRQGPESVHVLGKGFWNYHGLDRDAIIAELNGRYEEEHVQPA